MTKPETPDGTAIPKPEEETPKKEEEEDQEMSDEDEDSEDGMPLKKLAARRKRGQGTPATKVTIGRKTSILKSTPQDDDNLDFEDDTEDPKVVKKGKKATTNTSKKKATKTAEAKTEDDKFKKGKSQKSKKGGEDTKQSPNTDHAASTSGDEKHNEDDDLAACCLCHCALDYSDRSAFFEADRKQEMDNKSSGSEEEPLYFQPTDPYLPLEMFDPCNALVYCDTCDRLYHQKCHFVPLMVVPRGKWSCLVCTTKDRLTEGTAPGGRGKKKSAVVPAAAGGQRKDAPFTKHKLSRMFKSPLPPTKLQQYLTEDGNNKGYHTPAEMEWEVATGRDKAVLWNKTLTQTIPTWIQSQMSNLGQARTALETLTQTKQNRDHFLQNNASKRGSQELAQTLVKLTGAKWKMRQMVLNLEEIRANPERHIQLMQQWCQGAATKSSSSEDGQHHGHAAAATSNNALVQTAVPPKSFMERVVFPFGQYPNRTIPRTPEMEEAMKEEEQQQKAAQQQTKTELEKPTESSTLDDGIPREIVTSNAEGSTPKGKRGSKSNKHHHHHHHAKRHSKTSQSKKPKAAKDDDGSSSGVSLDDLVCAICLKGDATDENDLLLCDAQGCFRAYHMQCIEPVMTLKEVKATEGEDWFCPLCSGMAQCVHKIQSYYMGEDWDRRRQERAAAEKDKDKDKQQKEADNQPKEEHNNEDEEDDDDEDSLKSWEKPGDVFPESKWEYETALELKDGKRNDETDKLLREALGQGEDRAEGEGGGEVNILNYMSDGTDDVELDGHFDLEAFHEERKRQYEEMDEGGSGDDDDDDDDDESSHSSQATLVDMSSVELKIGKDELNALDGGSESESDEDSDDGSGSGSDSDDGSGGSESGGENLRRSRRLRKRENQGELPKNVGVEFDMNNIVQGKRRRKPVDYRKLNDALFGNLDAKENAKLDDKEDFHVPVPKKKVAKEDSDDDDDNNDSDNERGKGDGSDSEGSKENAKKDAKKNGKKKARASRKRSRPASDDEDIGSGNEAENDDSSVDSNQNKKKAAKKRPAKKKRRASPKPKKNVSKSAVAKEENGKKKAPKKQNGQNGKKASSGPTKKVNGSKAASGKGKAKAKESKAKAKSATKAKK